MIYDFPIEILILIFNFCINNLYLIKKSFKYFNFIINTSDRLIKSPKYLLFGGINCKDIYELDLGKKKISKINTLPFIINDGTCIRKKDKIFIINGNIDFLKFTNQIIIYNLTNNQIEDVIAPPGSKKLRAGKSGGVSKPAIMGGLQAGKA